MKKVILIISMFLGSFGYADQVESPPPGYGWTTNPKTLVEELYKLAKANNLEEAKKTLISPALETYGNEGQLKVLASESDHGKLKFKSHYAGSVDQNGFTNEVWGVTVKRKASGPNPYVRAFSLVCATKRDLRLCSGPEMSSMGFLCPREFSCKIYE